MARGVGVWPVDGLGWGSGGRGREGDGTIDPATCCWRLRRLGTSTATQQVASQARSPKAHAAGYQKQSGKAMRLDRGWHGLADGGRGTGVSEAA